MPGNEAPLHIPGRTLHKLADIGLSGHVIQQATTFMPRLRVDQPYLVYILKGAKHVLDHHFSLRIGEGELAIANAGSLYDYRNEINSSGEFQALWICFDRKISDAYYRTCPTLHEPTSVSKIPAIPKAFECCLWSIHDALSSTSGLPASITANRLAEALLWLREQGWQFSPCQPERLEERIRSRIASDTARDWQSKNMAYELGMGESTLRRHLSHENTSFMHILQDVRLSQALLLMQTTDTSIARIAEQVGYNCAARFSHAFRNRFGMLPREVRG